MEALGCAGLAQVLSMQCRQLVRIVAPALSKSRIASIAARRRRATRRRLAMAGVQPTGPTGFGIRRTQWHSRDACDPVDMGQPVQAELLKAWQLPQISGRYRDQPFMRLLRRYGKTDKMALQTKAWTVT